MLQHLVLAADAPGVSLEVIKRDIHLLFGDSGIAQSYITGGIVSDFSANHLELFKCLLNWT